MSRFSILAVLLLLAPARLCAFRALPYGGRARAAAGLRRPVAEATTDVESGEISDQFEVDVYSRPVVKDGTKLWEVLVCDATGSFRRAVELPSNMVNSREVRNAVAEIIDEAPTRPRTIRFFRKQMLNMLTIALQGIEDVEVVPSRNTFALRFGSTTIS